MRLYRRYDNDDTLVEGPVRVSPPDTYIRDSAVTAWGSGRFAVVFSNQVDIFVRVY